jgi:hypothetical protein
MSELIKMPRALAEKMLAAGIPGFDQKYFDKLEEAGMLTAKGSGKRDYSKIQPLADFNAKYNAWLNTSEIKQLVDALSRYKSIGKRAKQVNGADVYEDVKDEKTGKTVKKKVYVEYIREVGILPTLYYQGLQGAVQREDGSFEMLEKGEVSETSESVTSEVKAA